MKQLTLTHPNAQLNGQLAITGSKSESNRLLVLQALYPELQIQNLSNSDDTHAMQKGLAADENLIDIGHAGTTMRFLTAFFATQEGSEKVLTGSRRMQERPISVLVDALRQLGAEIEYEKNEGYPPLSICGKKTLKKSGDFGRQCKQSVYFSLVVGSAQTSQRSSPEIGGQNHLGSLYRNDMRLITSTRGRCGF
jgi:5-enolpyruvylshikimate-3-phosphate synthase